MSLPYPTSALEVGIVNSLIVHVDYPNPAGQLVEHKLCIHLSQDQTTKSVSKIGDFLNGLIAKTQVIAKHLRDVVVLNLNAVLFKYYFSYLRSGLQSFFCH